MGHMNERNRPVNPGTHVWAYLNDAWRPGLLNTWTRQADGWWADIALVDQDGDLAVFHLHQRKIRRTTTDQPPATPPGLPDGGRAGGAGVTGPPAMPAGPTHPRA